VTIDFYELLDVPRTASVAAIKAAFRAKAKTSHPDMGGDPETFHLLRLAHDVLTDEEARRHYDATGETPDERAASAAEEARFRMLVGDLIMTMIAQGSSPTFTNVLVEINDALALQIRGADQQIIALSELSARLEEVLARLHVREEGEDFLLTLLQERYDEMANKMKVTRDMRTRLIRLQQRLTRYTYDVQVESIA